MINWYVLRIMTGHEDKVRARLERKAECLNILLPKEEVIHKRDGKERKKLRPLFPGYIFVQMELQDEYWYSIKSTPGVINFIGCGNKPSPIEDIEIDNILERIEKGETKEPVPFEVGNLVQIIDGPFVGITGFVSDINPKKERIKVNVKILGKQVPVELSFQDIEKE